MGSPSVLQTFLAAVRSVGTAGTIATAGFYLHRRGLMSLEGLTTLAILSQHITIPALFFSKIIDCPQNFSQEPCPDVTDNLGNIWLLVIWPIVVVGMGMAVGHMAARISNTPPWQRRCVIAACAFPNSTGLPITLLTVIHNNFPLTSSLGRVDPNLFLSVFLLLYPILQWGIGGWLLAPCGDMDSSEDGIHHVLNVIPSESQEETATRMIKELSLTDLFEAKREGRLTHSETTELIHRSIEVGVEHTSMANPSHDIAPFMETIAKVLPKAMQPPVIAALLGIFIVSLPTLRGLFVDLHARASNAPFQWLFDGIHTIGGAAVPINMIILGYNLSLTSNGKKMDDAHVGSMSSATIFAIVIGKMIIMPLFGIASCLILKHHFLQVPEEIHEAFYLVLMVVTIT
jgi:predicted permease